jgi:hypothetical protein
MYGNESYVAEEIPIWAKDVGYDCPGIVAADGYNCIFVLRKKQPNSQILLIMI